MRLALLVAAVPLGHAIPRPLADEGAAEVPGTGRLGSAYHPRRDDEPHGAPDCTATQDNVKVVILADSNRDGIVDIEGSTDRGPGKESWSNESGALFLPNIGDSSDRCRKLHEFKDTLVKCNDASDDIQRAPKYLAPLRTVPTPGLNSSAVGRISVSDPLARKCVRIFRRWPSDQNSTQTEPPAPESSRWWPIFGKPKKAEELGSGWKIVGEDITFSAAELAQGLQLGIDARGPRGHLVAEPDAATIRPWDGRVTVQLVVTDGETTSTDSVMLRVAPLVTQNHLQRVTKVFASKDTDLAEYKVTLDGVASSAKSVGLNEPIHEMWWISGFIQDLFETMYASIPGPNGSTINLPIILPAPMKLGSILGPSAVAQQIRSTGVGMVTDVLPPEDNAETLDSMGNLETIPPYEFNGRNFSAGRIVVGANQTAGRVPLSLPFLQAQEMQDPLLVDTTWLEVQHVDEFLQFLPAETPLKWRVMVSDPIGAVRVLQDAQAAGRGNGSYSSQPLSDLHSFGTIDQLVNTEFIQINEECARRIRGTIEMLKRETGISDSDVLRVPVLYGRVKDPAVPSNGDSQAAAIFPNAINGLVMTDSLYVAPKQWGPLDAAGVDVLQHAVEMVYKQAGYKVDFVDDLNYYNRKGDIHCATNVFRELLGES
ncbi:Protein-arginine deiminase type-3 [Beauveria bassiana]|nr:Protein-arginine deiminase type-3 [Beauveria bassiana]KAH8718864.1 Protein-arginine deiminase type-3 [Beauveria bassiana]